MAIEREFTDIAGRQVLIVEDEYFLAEETADAVRRAGGIVLGPVPDLEAAMAIVASTTVDAAILDIRLGEDTSFPVAEALRAKGVRIIFVTGYDEWFLPGVLDDVPVYRKPADPDNIVRVLFQTKRDQTE